jgi:hypothetical protein
MSSFRTSPTLARAGILACLWLLLASAGAHAANALSDLRMALVAPPPSRTAPDITLSGKAAAQCAPVLDSVTLDRTDLDIGVKLPTTGCNNQRAQSFNLRINPAQSTGMPILSGQVYHVRVYASVDGATHLVAFRLLDNTNSPASAPVPENGFWWSQANAETGPASAGSGASIELQDGQLAVGLFGFTDVGAATWYFGSARPSGRIASVSLVQLANGDPPFAPSGSQPSAHAGPRLDLEFLSPTTARAWLIAPESSTENGYLQVRAMTLARSRFATGPVGDTWNGQWVLVDDANASARVFQFAQTSSLDAETFRLDDANSDATLECRTTSVTQQPETCSLTANSLPLADFDQVGIDRLDGHDPAGSHAKLIRLAH